MTSNKHGNWKKAIWIALVPLLLLAFAVLVVRLLPSEKPPGSIPETLSTYMTYEVINVYPHDPNAFTQGLIFHEGFLFESTGLYGESSLRKVVLETGEILQQINLSPDFFGEGLTLWDETLVQLTWQEGTGFVYALNDFTLLGQFTYPTEGWGLTHNGESLIMSDGSSRLHFLEPSTFQILGGVDVMYQDAPIKHLNELEFIHGEVYANIWLTDDVVRIDPVTGEVVGWIDLRGILPDALRTPSTDVLNGIAFDPDGNRLFVTGKKWPQLYEIRLVDAVPGD
jgi:glutamine cyclotransferase